MNNIFNYTFGRIVLASFVATSLAACADIKTTAPPQENDYRQTHKIKVTSEQISVSIAVPIEGTTLSPADTARFKSFLRDYVQRGRTVVTVESTQPDRMRKILMANGLYDGEIILVTNTTVKPPNVVLSFTAGKVISPECGDWSGPAFDDTNHGPHSNFGCAYQRNISKMVADPGDLLQAKPSAGGNASRSDAGIFLHQSGTPKERLLDGSGAAITGE